MVGSSRRVTRAAALLLSLSPAIVSACDGYQHGVGLHARDPNMDIYVERLRARHPSVNARVLQPHEVELAKRASPTTYAASLTNIQTAAVAALSSGTGTAEPTSPLPTTYTAGSTPPISGARPLPNVVINPADWPTLDRPPPTNSTQVAQWLAETNLTGIPSWAPNGINGCQNATNSAAVAAASDRCWWTCGGCTRATDITYCPAANTWGLSYDDGPSPWTPKLLDFLEAAELKTTIFTVASRAISRPEMLQFEYMEGHQIAVHTWSHFPLTTLSNEEIVAELGWSKKAIYEITGVTPKYMRPPYGDIDDRVRYISMQMGLTPIIWTAANGRTFDTQDWQIAGGVVNATTVMNNFDSILGMAPSLGHGFIVLEHDLYQQSVNLAVDYVLPKALSNPSLSVQPIIQCLGMDAAQAYVETADNSTAGPTSQIAGASQTGFVPGLTYTPQALGGDITTRPSVAPAGTTGGSSPSNGGASAVTDAVSTSGAMAVTTSAVLLLATFVIMAVLA